MRHFPLERSLRSRGLVVQGSSHCMCPQFFFTPDVTFKSLLDGLLILGLRSEHTPRLSGGGGVNILGLDKFSQYALFGHPVWVRNTFSESSLSLLCRDATMEWGVTFVLFTFVPPPPTLLPAPSLFPISALPPLPFPPSPLLPPLSTPPFSNPNRQVLSPESMNFAHVFPGTMMVSTIS